jgi:hypothetical protein
VTLDSADGLGITSWRMEACIHTVCVVSRTQVTASRVEQTLYPLSGGLGTQRSTSCVRECRLISLDAQLQRFKPPCSGLMRLVLLGILTLHSWTTFFGSDRRRLLDLWQYCCTREHLRQLGADAQCYYQTDYKPEEQSSRCQLPFCCECLLQCTHWWNEQ